MKRFAVIGLGRFGKKLAIALAMSGAEVIAIDKDRQLVDEIRDQVSGAVRLDSTDEEALKAQGVDRSDVAIVCIGRISFHHWKFFIADIQNHNRWLFIVNISISHSKIEPCISIARNRCYAWGT